MDYFFRIAFAPAAQMLRSSAWQNRRFCHHDALCHPDEGGICCRII